MQIWYEFQKLGERCVQTWEPFLFFFMGKFLPNIDDLKKNLNQMFCCKFSFFKWKKTFCLQKLLFEEGYTALVLSAGYRFNGPLQTCCQLRVKFVLGYSPLCITKLRKKTPPKKKKKTGSHMKNPWFSCPLPSHISYMP